MPYRIESWRSRTACFARMTAAGPTWSASGERRRPPSSRQPEHKETVKPARPRALRRTPSELELLEGQIAGVEARIAELEGKLADDWTNMDVLGAHRAARDELVALLERWEVVFGEAHAT